MWEIGKSSLGQSLFRSRKSMHIQIITFFLLPKLCLSSMWDIVLQYNISFDEHSDTGFYFWKLGRDASVLDLILLVIYLFRQINDVWRPLGQDNAFLFVFKTYIYREINRLAFYDDRYCSSGYVKDLHKAPGLFFRLFSPHYSSCFSPLMNCTLPSAKRSCHH